MFPNILYLLLFRVLDFGVFTADIADTTDLGVVGSNVYLT